jgi:hypothetical protein
MIKLIDIFSLFFRFQSGAAQRIAEEILSSSLSKVKYDSEQAPELSRTIANQILAAIRSMCIRFSVTVSF